MEEMSSPKSLEEVIAGLQGFGLSEFEEILTIKVGEREVRLCISNLATEEEMTALVAVEEFKGYAWIQRVRIEILSRCLSKIDGVDLRRLQGAQRLVADKDGVQRDIQVVLRNLLLGWGQEVVLVLWKVLMTHCQTIEQRLFDQFPDSAVMTEYEKRFVEQAMREIEAQNAEQVREQLADLYEPSVDDQNSDEGK